MQRSVGRGERGGHDHAWDGDGAEDALLHLLRVHRPHEPPEPAHLLRPGGVATLVNRRGLSFVHVELHDARDQQLDIPDRAELAQTHVELVADEDREALDHSVGPWLDGVKEPAVHEELHVFLCSQFLIQQLNNIGKSLYNTIFKNIGKLIFN